MPELLSAEAIKQLTLDNLADRQTDELGWLAGEIQRKAQFPDGDNTLTVTGLQRDTVSALQTAGYRISSSRKEFQTLYTIYLL